ncbi:MAG: hypothetical protein A2150_01585 [Candidatus Muproteobacteria bacterium RBG_16_64_11]|uniref:Uncharacterized protein n=1 Tax=Candidatus Muproteobacteria bacterium RBG_16_64_11 TaxID=1817758 RepID=A0A1F6TI34_9PROT|nr:MAG: hypothetical protein A2150_01585 [Candidatus Muproteobacteria bacterium RBG_16_64_11]
MHDAQGVRALHAAQRLLEDPQRVVDRQGAMIADALRQRLALDVLHHQHRSGVGFMHAVCGDDVRVVEAGLGARLASEALQERLIAQ